MGEGAHKKSLEDLLEEALSQYTPLDLINTVLLDGMKTVGDLFGARKMQLPSVLDSAGGHEGGRRLSRAEDGEESRARRRAPSCSPP